jgi:hypothetical protein
MSRIFAREASMKVTAEGLRWIGGASGPGTDELEKKLGASAIYRAQAGLLQDMDYLAHVLYGRPTK